MRRSAIILLCCALLGSPASLCDDTLRVATCNILNYPGADAAQRNPRFRTVLRAIDPDVLIVQEMTRSAGVTQLRDQVLNAVLPGAYASVPFDDGPDTDNALFYKPARIAFLGAAYISTPLRRIAEYRFLAGGAPDTVRLYSLHLKGNQEDSLDRLAKTTILRNVMNALPPRPMVANPVATPLDSVILLFPGCGRRTAYRFETAGGYVPESRLLNGTGYWLKCGGGEVEITGAARERDSIFVPPGRNMIGGLSVMVDTAAIEAFPTGLVASPYFHYKTGFYVQADTLFPGSGYWVKASGSGMLILGAPAAGNGPQIDAERTDSRRYRQGRGVVE